MWQTEHQTTIYGLPRQQLRENLSENRPESPEKKAKFGEMNMLICVWWSNNSGEKEDATWKEGKTMDGLRKTPNISVHDDVKVFHMSVKVSEIGM